MSQERNFCPRCGKRLGKNDWDIHTCTSPQRAWVGLTDEEIKDCFKITPDQHLPWHIYQRIEAKLKEKNT